MTCSSYDNSTYLLYAHDDAGNSKYVFFDNIDPGKKIDVTFENMNDFDNIVSFSFPISDNVFLYVQGRESDQNLAEQGYLLRYHYATISPIGSINAGYLARLSNYLTILSVHYPSHFYSYTKKGDIPAKSPDFPEAKNFNLADKTIKSFLSETSVPYFHRESTWNYKEAVNGNTEYLTWKVISPKNTQKIMELPKEIVEMYPLLNLEKLEHTATTFYVKADSYEKLITDRFKAAGPSGDVEYLSISIRQ